jgi:hypothetical protein
MRIRIRISFTHTALGLSTRDENEVTGFGIAGNDWKGITQK